MLRLAWPPYTTLARASPPTLEHCGAGESYLTTAENDPNGLRVVVNGKTAQFTNDEDPCSLRTTVPGRAVWPNGPVPDPPFQPLAFCIVFRPKQR